MINFLFQILSSVLTAISLRRFYHLDTNMLFPLRSRSFKAVCTSNIGIIIPRVLFNLLKVESVVLVYLETIMSFLGSAHIQGL
jgi:hypothetical protein